MCMGKMTKLFSYVVSGEEYFNMYEMLGELIALVKGVVCDNVKLSEKMLDIESSFRLETDNALNQGYQNLNLNLPLLVDQKMSKTTLPNYLNLHRGKVNTKTDQNDKKSIPQEIDSHKNHREKDNLMTNSNEGLTLKLIVNYESGRDDVI